MYFPLVIWVALLSLSLSSPLLASTPFIPTANPNLTARSHSASDEKRNSQGLNEAAQAAGKLYFGTATDPNNFGHGAYMRILNGSGGVRDFGGVSVENAMKWDVIHPAIYDFNWAAADRFVSVAEANKQLVRCHTLLWHRELPAWLEYGNFDKATLTRIMKAHVISLVQHFRGKCYAWDVANEVLNDDGTLRDSIWSRTIGPAFVSIAFKAAQKADPEAKLYINEFDIENDYGIASVERGSYFAANAPPTLTGGKAKEKGKRQTISYCKDCGRRKIEGLKEVVKLVRESGARVDGVGFQSHFEYCNIPDADTLERIMKEFTAMGLDTAITELDVRIDLSQDGYAAQDEQASGYSGVVRACRNVQRCVGVTVWEFSDYWGWTSASISGWGSALPWDSVLAKKQKIYNAILEGWNG